MTINRYLENIVQNKEYKINSIYCTELIGGNKLYYINTNIENVRCICKKGIVKNILAKTNRYARNKETSYIKNRYISEFSIPERMYYIGMTMFVDVGFYRYDPNMNEYYRAKTINTFCLDYIRDTKELEHTGVEYDY